MKMGSRSLVIGLPLFGAPFAASACEPIVPFIKAVGGPGVLGLAFLVLGTVVLVKSAAFARFQTKISFRKALLCMLAANVFTSIVGVIVPARMDSGAAMFIAVPLVWAVCLLPAQRLIVAAPVGPLTRFTSGQVAFGIMLVLVVSYLLLLVSRTVHDSAGFLSYWLVKLPIIYLALAIGLVLTAFLEEWIVWRLTNSEDDDISFVRPVVRANVIALAVVVLISTAFIIPKRVKASGYVPPAKGAAQTTNRPPR
jgi:hypothetical protein